MPNLANAGRFCYKPFLASLGLVADAFHSDQSARGFQSALVHSSKSPGTKEIIVTEVFGSLLELFVCEQPRSHETVDVVTWATRLFLGRFLYFPSK
jgi:hypothetical protein